MPVSQTAIITGSLYDARTGTKVTTGRLYLKLTRWTYNGPDLVVPKTVYYDVPGSGNWNLALCPSNGVDYFVEFDPNPGDTVTPLRLKDGYWSNYWDVPYATVDISDL